MPVLTKINTNSIAEDAITGDKFAGDAYLANTANQNISGTYSENRLYTSDAYTLSGNATVNSHLTLSSIKPTADVVLTAGGAYTLTGTGVLSAGSLLAKERTDLTNMTGELGSSVTQATGFTLGSGVTGGSGLTALGTVTEGTLGSGITFPAGHTLSWTSYAEPSTSLSLASLGQSGYNILAVGGTVRSATVLAGNKLWITMSGGYIRFAGNASEASAGFIYTTSGTDPANVSYGGTVPSTVALNGLGVPSNNATTYRGLGTVQFLYENSTGSSVTVKFCPCVKNQGVNWAWLKTDTQHQLNFTIASIQG